jgi:PAS domain S-box-containing protein
MTDQIRVLHVDDEPGFAELVAEFLERDDSRFEVTPETDPVRAMELFEERPFDAVVTDYQMPELDGIAVIERVRGLNPELPVILYTGRGSEDVASEAISAGVTDYLQKDSGPTHYDLLANRILNAVERHRAGREAERLGRRFQTLYDNPLLLGAVLEPDGTVRTVNETALELTGTTTGDCEGEPFWAVSWWAAGAGDPDPAEMRERVSRAAAGETVRFRVRLDAVGDRDVRTVVGVLTPVTGGDGTVESVLALGQDVTGAADYLWTGLDTLEELFFIFDGDGRLHEWNAAVPAVTGYAPEALRSLGPTEFVAPPDVEAVVAALERVAETGSASVRARIETAAGDRIPYEFRASRLEFADSDDGRPGFVGVGHDVSDRERRERALERLHAVTRELVSAGDHRAVADLVADAVDDVLGYPRTVVRLHEDGVLRPVTVTGPARSVLGERPVYAVDEGPPGRAFAAGETVVLEDVRTVDDDQDRGEVRGSLFVPIGEHGVIGVAATAVDAFDDSDVRTVETLAANAAAAMDRIAETRAREAGTRRVERLAGVIGRDLHRPLTVARGEVEAARDRGEESLASAARALDRASSLVDDLSTLLGDGVTLGETEPVALGKLVETCWRNVPAGEASLAAETTQTVRADRRRLKQLVENLLDNAVEHGGPGVTVTVGPLTGGRGFYVADDGPGVPADERERVFETGYSLTEDGTGVGLSVVREVARAHGWSVTLVESAAGGVRVEVEGVEVRS